ncbi:hypothetical protein [Rhizobium leguminosarum]|uniref:hypothetical protein n=1 Tax=Rhizobium leguminosarum TaxID=384 RepID=UPI0010307BED|nr:hypothetical protein [Rhizobium leguminosarum]TAV51909.1 hypothetical protein ELI29_01625 [Rhizobium leguminosarum]
MILAASQLASRFTRIHLIMSRYSRISLVGSIVLFEFPTVIVMAGLSHLQSRLFSKQRLGKSSFGTDMKKGRLPGLCFTLLRRSPIS